MGPRIDVSIVIPTRNRWLLVQETLASALEQKDVVFEIIVVDDGSDDEAAQRLADLSDERIRVLRHETRQGQVRARNTGVAAARGEWIAFLDDDDLWSPEKLRLQLEAAGAAGANFVYGEAILIDEARHAVVHAQPAPHPQQLRRTLIAYNAMPAGASNVLAHAGLLQRTGGFDERLNHLADWDMWLRLAECGGAAVCPEILVGYRQHAANLLQTERGDVRPEFAYLAAKHRALSDEEGIPFDPVAFSHWVAGGQRRAGRRLAAARTHLRAAVAYRSIGHLGCAVRSPLGSWAMGLRQPAAATVTPPEWVRPHLSW